jgi:thymidylate synthase
MTQFNTEYRKLVIKILTDSTLQKCRNGEQLIIPHYSFTIDDMKNDHTLLLRKMYYKGVLGEFKTIIDSKPLTNVSQFEANGCNYWKKWSGPNGELRLDYHDELAKQLPGLIEGIKNDPNSRRHVISLWNHENVSMGVLSLACCWWGLTFSVINNTLHLTWTQRSVDTTVGLPSDVYLAYLFMDHIAKECDLAIGSCMFSLSNVHVYTKHIENAYELVKRTDADYDKPLKFELYE